MIVVLMGVSGAGKTTVGRLLASRLGWAFVDGDDLHPPANVEKMRSGVPLDDADRWPWLDALREIVRQHLSRGEPLVLACSALRRSYQEHLRLDRRVRLVHLRATFELIRQRLRARRGHFMKEDLLASQFAELEEPHDVCRVDAARAPEEIVDDIIARCLQADAGASRHD